MKKDKRISRYYDLNNSQPFVNAESHTSASSDSLVGWWNFTDNLTVNQKTFPNKAKNGSVTGAFVDTSAAYQPPIAVEEAGVETPVFLDGIQHNSRAAITIKESRAYKLENLPDEVGDTFTFSMTFKFLGVTSPLPLPNGEDVRVQLAEFRQTGGGAYYPPFCLIYDGDGAGSSHETIRLLVRATDGTSEAWNIDLRSMFGGAAEAQAVVRDWIRLDFVLHNHAGITGPAPLQLGLFAHIYINGVKASAQVDPSNITGKTVQNRYSAITAGKCFSAGVRSIQLAEVALWTSALSEVEIKSLYAKTVSSRNSGIISNPVNNILDCEESHDDYPTIPRSGDYRRLGKRQGHFDDYRLPIADPVAGSTINYPTLLETGSQAEGAIGDIIATPNTLPTIYATAPEEALLGISKIRKGYNRCADTDFSDDYIPFDDSRIPADLAVTEGFLHEQLAGFDAAISNRIVIDIDITPSQEAILKVVTGSEVFSNAHPLQGETFNAGQSAYPSERFTGLSYFNFVTKKYEPMGGRLSETGTRVRWSLPAESSSSLSYSRTSIDGSNITYWKLWIGTTTDYVGTTINAWRNVDYISPYASCSDPAPFDRSLHPVVDYEDWTTVPRIFQPYSSIVSHRNTFNHVHGTSVTPVIDVDNPSFAGNRTGRSINTFKYFQGKTYFMPEGEGVPNNVRRSTYGYAEELTPVHYAGDYFNVGVTPASSVVKDFLKPYKSANGHGHGGYSGTRYEWMIWGDDSLGVGADGYYRRQPGIWNDEADIETSGSLKSNFAKTFNTLGRPVTYTNWNINSMFHASSSQLLRMSDYIDSPMILEAVQFDSDVEVVRKHAPFSKLLDAKANNAANFPPADFPEVPSWAGMTDSVFQWSNTNNHIDNLTYFLLRQNQTNDPHDGPQIKQMSSVRELVTFSNNIFSSKYVGWDFFDRYPRHVDPYLSPSPSMCGARCSRVFEVYESEVKANVPGVDNFTYYRNSDGTLPTAFGGAGGIFFTKTNTPHDILGHVPMSNTDKNLNPTEHRFLTASTRISKISPVRVCEPYAQHTTPVLPIIAGQHRGGLSGSIDYSSAPVTKTIVGPNKSGDFSNYFSGIARLDRSTPAGPMWALNGGQGPSNIVYFFRGGLMTLTGRPKVPGHATIHVPSSSTAGQRPYTIDYKDTRPNYADIRSWPGDADNPRPGIPPAGPTGGTYDNRINYTSWISEPVMPRRMLSCMGTLWPGGSSFSVHKKPIATTFDFMSASNHLLDPIDFDTWTHPMGVYTQNAVSGAHYELFSSGGIPKMGKFPYNDVLGREFANVFEPPKRNVVGHEGSTVPTQDNTTELFTNTNDGSPVRLGMGWTPVSYKQGFANAPIDAYNGTSAQGSNAHASPNNGAMTKSVLPDHPNKAPPYHLGIDTTGPTSKNSGYVLLPSDNLILGVQFSPADAVWRSRTAVSASATANIYGGCGNQPGPLSWTPTLTSKIISGGPLAKSGGHRGPLFQDSGSMNVPMPFDFYGQYAENGSGGNGGSMGEHELAYGANFAAAEVGLQAYRMAGYCESNDLITNAAAMARIKTSKSTLRLFGTLVRDQRQKHSSLPQQLTTLGVHEVVGNEPVLDQYDLIQFDETKAYRFSRLVSGSLSNAVDTWAVDSDSKSYDWMLRIIGRGERRSLEMGNLYDVGKINYNQTLVDRSEYYYDSLPPSVPGIFGVLGIPQIFVTASLNLDDSSSTAPDPVQPEGNAGTNTPANAWVFPRRVFPILKLGAGNIESTNIEITETGTAASHLFGRSFPFEPKFAGINRAWADSSQASYYYRYQSDNYGNLPMFYTASYDKFNATAGFPRRNAQSGFRLPGFTPYWTPWQPLTVTNKVFTDRPDFKPSTCEMLAEPDCLSIETGGHTTPIDESDLGLRSLHAARGEQPHLVPTGFVQTGKRSVTADKIFVSGSFQQVRRNTEGNSRRIGFFGVGDSRDGLLQHAFYYMAYRQESPGLITPSATDVKRPIIDSKMVCRKPRAYRYGLIAASPKPLTAVFRRNSFGQFRDMLEQRKYPALFVRDDQQIAEQRRLDGLKARRNRVTRPISANFRSAIFENPQNSGRQAKVDPADTNSCNLNRFASSSLPFFDGELKNRDAEPTVDELVVIGD